MKMNSFSGIKDLEKGADFATDEKALPSFLPNEPKGTPTLHFHRMARQQGCLCGNSKANQIACSTVHRFPFIHSLSLLFSV